MLTFTTEVTFLLSGWSVVNAEFEKFPSEPKDVKEA